jgi:hypothetical protein
LTGPGGFIAACSDRYQSPRQEADHVMAKGVGLHPQVNPAWTGSFDIQFQQITDGRGARAGHAVGREIVFTQQRNRRRRHRCLVQSSRPPNESAFKRVLMVSLVGNPVTVAPPQR